MSKNTPLGKDASSEEYLKIAENFFLHVLKELQRKLSAVAKEEEEAASLAKPAQELRRAIQIVFDERKRLEQSSTNQAGDNVGTTLDLAQARDEIGRRLACLRDANGTGQLSE